MDRRVGRYELVRLLGRGGMGEVWEAVLHGPQGFRRRVALKLAQVGPRTEEDRAALVREARLGALASHPNVVGVHDLGVLPDRGWYVAMELVNGASVSAVMRAGPMPAWAIVEIGVQACAGLAHLHGLRDAAAPRGILHRDVKPGNLLVDRSGLVKLGDLGLAGLAGQGGGLGGTPGFTAPEQLAGRADPRADLFGLGAVLYAMAARVPPFPRGVVDASAFAARIAAPGFLAPVEAVLPELGPVVRRCLDPDLGRRFQEAGEVRAALEAIRPPGGGTVADLLATTLSTSTPGSPTPAANAPTERRLPAVADLFFGRAEELAGVVDALEGDARLVTLMGPGGMGKTRLAMEVARTLDERLTGGSWFCDLSDARSVDDLCGTVARAFGIVLDAGDPVAQVGHALASRGDALAVLDNLEQIAGEGGVVARWHALAPAMRLLVTSRVALRLKEERTVALPPLEPDAAVALFLARAPGVPASDRKTVEALVARLDGMPLAIELAAARARVIPVADVLGRLDDRFRVLAGGGPDRPSRHRSLRASLDGSWELLGAAERAALAQLSVFADGVPIAAAEVALDLADLPDAPWPLDVLGALANHSLIRYDRASDRFRMYAAVQEYAAERLEDRAAAEARHGLAFARYGDPTVLASLHGPEGIKVWRKLAADLDNLEEARRRAVHRRDPEVAGPVAVAAWAVRAELGPYPPAADALAEVAVLARGSRHEGRVRLALAQALRLADRGVEAAREAERAEQIFVASADLDGEVRALEVRSRVASDAARTREAVTLAELALARARGRALAEARVWVHLAPLLPRVGRADEALAGAERALAAFREARDALGEATALEGVARLLYRSGHGPEARAACERALAMAEALGRRGTEAALRQLLAMHLAEAGWFDEATAELERAVSLLRRIGNRHGEGRMLGQLGVVAGLRGRLDDAERRFREAMEVQRAVGDLRSVGVSMGNLANLLRERRRFGEARAAYQEALEVHRANGDRENEALVLLNLGLLDPDTLDEALAVSRMAGARAVEGCALRAIAEARWARGERGAAEAALVESERILRDGGWTLELARTLCTRVRWCHADGDVDGARAALGGVEGLVGGRRLEADAAFARLLADTRALVAIA